MTDKERADEWIRYFKVVPKMSTLKAVERNDGKRVLENVIRGLGLGSVLDVIRECKGDEW